MKCLVKRLVKYESRTTWVFTLKMRRLKSALVSKLLIDKHLIQNLVKWRNLKKLICCVLRKNFRKILMKNMKLNVDDFVGENVGNGHITQDTALGTIDD